MYVSEIRIAAKECLDRGLVIAAKWYAPCRRVASSDMLRRCSELLLSTPASKRARRPHRRYRFEPPQSHNICRLLNFHSGKISIASTCLVSLHLQINLPLLLRFSPNLLQLFHLLFLITTLLFLPGKICAPLNRSWKWRKRMHSKLLGHVSKHATSFMQFTY
jgi:hypothetical protein